MHDMTLLLDRLAARQLGLVTRRQLLALGMTEWQLRWRLECRFLVPVRHGVYRLAGTPITWEQVVLAAALAAGEPSVISHSTAAAVWDLKHSDRHTAGIHVTADRLVRAEGVTGHRSKLTDRERTIHRSIPVTVPERTIVDLAGVLDDRQLAECVDDGLRRRLIGLRRLRELVEEAGASRHGRRLLAPLHQLLADRDPGYRCGDSDWEQAMDRQWDLLGLPQAIRQFRVTAEGRSYRIDRALPEIKVGVEWDGFDIHGTRSAFDHDCERRADLTAAGWHIIDFTSKSTPDQIVRTILRVVRDRSGLATRTGTG